MYKLLLVDDDQFVIDGIRTSTDWRKIGIGDIYEAKNGLEALEVVRQENPDIVITDVKMPVMDGIEFAEKAMKQNSDLKVIVLSGYDDFSYVQSALRKGTFDYILKPVAVEELIEIVEKCREVMEKERKDRKIFSDGDILLRNKYVRELLNGCIGLESVKERYDKINIAGSRFVVLAVQFEKLAEEAAKQYGPIDGLNDYYEKCSQFISHHLNAETVGENPDKLIIIAGFDAALSDLRMQQNLEFFLYHLKVFVENFLKDELTIGIGSIVEGSRRIGDSYKEALKALESSFFKGVGKELHYHASDYRSAVQKFAYPSDLEEKLVYHIKVNDTDSVEECVKQVKTVIRSISSINPEEVKRTYTQLSCNILYKLVNTAGLKDTISDSSIDNLFIEREVSKQRTIASLEVWFDQYLNTITLSIHEQKKTSNTTVIQRITKYINSNYHRDVSLRDISNAVFLTPTYVANIFKNETGETVMDYVTRVRVEKAKELLLNSQNNNIDIAMQVGYDNAKYFGQVFKKYVGMTPKEYRESKKGI